MTQSAIKAKAKARAKDEYRQRQVDGAHSIRMTDDQKARVRQYAIDNSMSESEAVREFIQAWVTGDPVIGRRRRTSRLTIWCPPDQWVAFTRKAAERGVSQTDAIDAAIQEGL